ncbi:MAG: hypothetical protein SFV32_12140 [Opitutaceae bacterium]|nr:hypothetical protein [Opitutaceae bacterium]
MKLLTISKAKARLGALADGVARTGKPVLIQRRGKIFELRERPIIEPFDFPPVGDLPVSERAAELQGLVEEINPLDTPQ